MNACFHPLPLSIIKSWFIEICSRWHQFSSRMPLYLCRRRGRNKVTHLKKLPIDPQTVLTNILFLSIFQHFYQSKNLFVIFRDFGALNPHSALGVKVTIFCYDPGVDKQGEEGWNVVCFHCNVTMHSEGSLLLCMKCALQINVLAFCLSRCMLCPPLAYVISITNSCLQSVVQLFLFSCISWYCVVQVT